MTAIQTSNLNQFLLLDALKMKRCLITLTSTVLLDELDVVDTKKQEVTKPDNRKGSSHRKSYTVEFKAKTLESLDLFSHLQVKKKCEKVGEEQGISKSLVVKCNKKKIKAETECSERAIQGQ